MRGNTISGILVFATLGAIIATAGDANHVHTSTLSYPEPWLMGQAGWVFPGFLLAFIGMGWVYTQLVTSLPAGLPVAQSTSRGNPRLFVEAVVAFFLVYLLSGFGNQEPSLLSVIFYGSFALRWLFTYDRAWLLLLAVLMGIGGMLVEGTMSAAGVVTYRHVDVYHVPFWLGGVYMHGAFGLREGMRLFVYREARVCSMP